MITPLNLQIAIIVLLVMPGMVATRPAQGQTMPAPAAGAPADTSTTKAPDRQEVISSGSSRWTAGATSFASPDKGAWGGSHSFSSTLKSAWTPSSQAFSQGASQPGGVWRARPIFSTPPDGAVPTNHTEAENVSVEPATSRGAISGMGHQSGIGSRQSSIGSRQLGISARHPTMSARQFGPSSQGKTGGKPALGISGQRRSFTATSFGSSSQPGSVGARKNGSIGPGDRPGAPTPGLWQHRLGSSLGGTGSGFDPNPWEFHSGHSKPQ